MPATPHVHNQLIPTYLLALIDPHLSSHNKKERRKNNYDILLRKAGEEEQADERLPGTPE